MHRAADRFASGLREAGIEEYAAILAADPNKLDVGVRLGKAQLAAGHYQDAVATTEKMLAIAPKDAVLLTDWGLALESG